MESWHWFLLLMLQLTQAEKTLAQDDIKQAVLNSAGSAATPSQQRTYSDWINDATLYTRDNTDDTGQLSTIIKRNPIFSLWGGQRLSDLLYFKRRPAFSSWGGKRGPAFSSWGGKRSALHFVKTSDNITSSFNDYQNTLNTPKDDDPQKTFDDTLYEFLRNKTLQYLPKTKIITDGRESDDIDPSSLVSQNFSNNEYNFPLQNSYPILWNDNNINEYSNREDVENNGEDYEYDNPNNLNNNNYNYNNYDNDDDNVNADLENEKVSLFNANNKRTSPSFNSWGGKRALSFSNWGSKWIPTSNHWQGKKATAFNSWGGKRSPEFTSWKNKQSPAFNSWGDKRSPAFNSWGGKRSPAFNSWGGKRSPAFNSWGGKRSPAFNSWGGKRSPAFNSWGGKRFSPFTDFPEEEIEDEDNNWQETLNVQRNKRSLPALHFDEKHTPSFNTKETDKYSQYYVNEKRSPAFNSWGGKRAPAFNSWGGKRAPAFNSWGGKRAPAFNSWGGKRAPAFNSWGGKRAPAFNSWGGKRAPAFNSWGGKRAPAFNSWGGKRAPAFNSWGGKRAPAFNSWGGKRAPAFNSWGGKRAPAFNSWGGKRSSTDNTQDATGSELQTWDDMQPSASWASKRDYEDSLDDKRTMSYNRGSGKRLPAFHSWGGKRLKSLPMLKPKENNISFLASSINPNHPIYSTDYNDINNPPFTRHISNDDDDDDDDDGNVVQHPQYTWENIVDEYKLQSPYQFNKNHISFINNNTESVNHRVKRSDSFNTEEEPLFSWDSKRKKTSNNNIQPPQDTRENTDNENRELSHQLTENQFTLIHNTNEDLETVNRIVKRSYPLIQEDTGGKRNPAFFSWGGKRNYTPKVIDDNKSNKHTTKTQLEDLKYLLSNNDNDPNLQIQKRDTGINYNSEYLPQYSSLNYASKRRPIFPSWGGKRSSFESDESHIRNKRYVGSTAENAIELIVSDSDIPQNDIGSARADEIYSMPAGMMICCLKRAQYGDRNLFMQMLLRTKSFRDLSWPTIRPIRRGSEFYSWGGKRSL